MAPVAYTYMPSPVGPLLLAADNTALRLVEFSPAGKKTSPDPQWQENAAHSVLIETQAQLEAYFSGKRKAFSIELAPRGTEYQCTVWSELQRIPYGTTVSYGELARRLGNPNGSRAVGAANGRNPIPIIIPCHRVIGADGSLTGFGGGLPIKQFLLRLEGALPIDDLFGT